MADTGWKPVTVAVNDSTTGSYAWSGIPSLSAAVSGPAGDGAYAQTGDMNAGTTSWYLYGRAPDMSSIPSGATITGIEARIWCMTRSDAQGQVRQAYFRKTTTAGANVGNNLAATPKNMSRSSSVFGSITFGSSTDLSGATYSLAEIQASGFGFAFSCFNSDGKNQIQPRLDLVEIRVTYQTGATYNEAASGGVVVGGTSKNSIVVSSITASGGVVAGGSSIHRIVSSRAASGGVVVGGTSINRVVSSITASGGVVVGGPITNVGGVPLYYTRMLKYSRLSLQRLKNPNLPAYRPTYD